MPIPRVWGCCRPVLDLVEETALSTFGCRRHSLSSVYWNTNLNTNLAPQFLKGDYHTTGTRIHATPTVSFDLFTRRRFEAVSWISCRLSGSALFSSILEKDTTFTGIRRLKLP